MSDMAFKIAATARKYIGVRFHHQGRNRTAGMDCIGLLVIIAEDLALPIKDVSNYRRIPDGKSLIRNLDEQLEKIDALEMGCIIVFWIVRPDRPQHVGIYTGDGMIHTHAGIGKVVHSAFGESWRKRVHSMYKYRGV